MRRQLPKCWDSSVGLHSSRLLRAGDRFDSDCVVGTQFESSQPHHTILRELRFSCLSSKRRELALLCAIDLSLQTSDRTSHIFCIRLSLAAKSRFPAGETDLNGDLVRLRHLLRRKAKHLVLPGPLQGKVGKVE